ncbi:MAG TPA: ABC transporter permease subunit [Candidatus Limnocylindrales bacterium]|nr:ABC transporter permease subunit [Candidatus Limnocylindrales bacterium]
MTAAATTRPAGQGWLGRFTAGLTAVVVKELRGRMRGRRAFVILTVYLALVAVFAWMCLGILEARASNQVSSSTFISSQVGQQLFAALLLLETLFVPFLAPALTASAISLEREKQTLDMLTATPISTLGLVLGKLFSALTYVFLLVFASIPLTALVFVFGGVGYEELATGYLVLIVTAIGFGSIGLFFSALVQRTQAATVLTYIAVFALTAGAMFVWIFWRITAPDGPVVTQQRPPEALLYFNPFVAQAEIIHDAEVGTGAFCNLMSDSGLGAFCSLMNDITDSGFDVVPMPIPATQPADLKVPLANVGQGALTDVAQPPVVLAVSSETIWPKAMLAWIALSVVLIALSVRLVSPRRRRSRMRRPREAGQVA